MNNLKQKLAWSPNFIKEFGIQKGIPLLLQITRQFSSHSKQVQSYAVPGYREKIFLRETIADHATFKQCLVTNQYDFFHFPQAARLKNAYEATLNSGKNPLIIDAGANIGLATLWFNRHFPEAHIVAIEPEDNNFELLQKNTSHLTKQITLIKGGIWHRTARLEIVNPDSGSASFRIAETSGDSTHGFKAFSIDEICNLANNQNPLIVKLDIEGSQAHLFSANTDWVSRTDLITLELDDWLLPWQGTSRNFFSCLSQYPFDYLIHKESIFCFLDKDKS